MKKLKAILPQFQNKKILVVGDVGIDKYTTGTVDRISPEAPVPILRVEGHRLKLGLAANVADNVHALSGAPLLVGVVGDDAAADSLREMLAYGIDSSHLVTDPGRKTILKERFIADRQQLLRIDYEDAEPISHGAKAMVYSKISTLMEGCDAVIIEDYAKGMLSESLTDDVIRLAKHHNKIVAVDPNLKCPYHHYIGATVLTPNLKEAEFLSGMKIKDDEGLKAAGFEILSRTQAKYIVITCGKDGMAIFGEAGLKRIPTYAKEVFDVSGAGDTVVSVLTLALAAGASIYDACVLGNVAAGIEVSKPGTATVSLSELADGLSILT